VHLTAERSKEAKQRKPSLFSAKRKKVRRAWGGKKDHILGINLDSDKEKIVTIVGAGPGGRKEGENT